MQLFHFTLLQSYGYAGKQSITRMHSTYMIIKPIGSILLCSTGREPAR